MIGTNHTKDKRHGEKDHEVLCSREEMFNALDLGDYFKISSDNRDLNYEIFENKGMTKEKINEYSSSNTHNLDVEQMIKLLNKVTLD
mgnify:CR=1 FL=1